MNSELKSILFGIFLGLILLIPRYLHIYPTLPAVIITALFTGWYYQKVSDQSTIFRQTLPSIVSAGIVGIISNVLTLVTSEFYLIKAFGSSPQIMLDLIIGFIAPFAFGFFIGLAGYHLKGIATKILIKGAILLLVTILITLFIQLLYFVYFPPDAEEDYVGLFFDSLSMLYLVIPEVILLGISLTALYAPFCRLLKEPFVVYMLVGSYLVVFIGFVTLLIACFTLPLPGQLPELSAKYSPVGYLLVFIIIGASLFTFKRLKNTLEHNHTIAYMTALLTISTLLIFLDLILAVFLPGFTNNRPAYYVKILTIPQALMIVGVVVFPLFLKLFNKEACQSSN